MSRIPTPGTIDSAPAASQPLLQAVKQHHTDLGRLRGHVSGEDFAAVKTRKVA
jgi:hypothetical protein